jgi:hypothetical protein
MLSQSQRDATQVSTGMAAAAPPQLWLGLTPQFIAKIFRQMVEGLSFLHLHGVIHAGYAHDDFLFLLIKTSFIMFIVVFDFSDT